MSTPFALGGEATRARFLSDPVFAARLLRIAARGGSATSRIRRRCVECGLESNPGGIGWHLKFSEHAGWEEA